MIRLDLVVGPNGSGKTTFVQYVIAPVVTESVFVNADEIAKQRWPDTSAEHSYEAAQIAAATRAALIERHRPFIAETVFSHPSKLELIREAKAAGYVVFLHVMLVPENLAVARVAHRVAAGGHRVPVRKIRERYRRLWTHVAEAVELVDSAVFYDTADDQQTVVVARFAYGEPVGGITWPAWTPRPLTLRWPDEPPATGAH